MWSTMANMCSRLISLHKCNWHLIAWELDSGHLMLMCSTTTALVVRDCHDSQSMVHFLSPDQPNAVLGFHICSNGNQLPHYHHTYNKVVHLCSQLWALLLCPNRKWGYSSNNASPQRYLMHLTAALSLTNSALSKILSFDLIFFLGCDLTITSLRHSSWTNRLWRVRISGCNHSIYQIRYSWIISSSNIDGTRLWQMTFSSPLTSWSNFAPFFQKQFLNLWGPHLII